MADPQVADNLTMREREALNRGEAMVYRGRVIPIMHGGTDDEEGGEGADTRPEWLPDNFKSPEDLAKSYQEAQRKITELSTQNRGLEESIGELSSQFEAFTSQVNQPDPNEIEAQWLAAYEQNPIATMQTLAQQTAEAVHKQYAQQAQDPNRHLIPLVGEHVHAHMARKYDDWEQYASTATGLLQNDPILRSNKDLWLDAASLADATERAYKLAKFEDLSSGQAVVQQQLAETRQMKLQAQSASGAAGRPESPDAAEARWSEIMSAQTGKLDL